jgi:tetratricopeptide (TPR) repeat protein
MTYQAENNKETLNIFTIISIAVIFILAIIPFIQNYKYNDNHLNWLNHDYAKNLLMATEESSVFMTEGGDNQVFGSLYFIYAEKLRPDLSPYDQKGNIFKRIYGDMRYAYPNILSTEMGIVDTFLFASEEPFYDLVNNNRSQFQPYFVKGTEGLKNFSEFTKINFPNNPEILGNSGWMHPTVRGQMLLYFIPYWQGKRPVYLTWQRPNPWSLGDYYYKRYGIMYKVQDIEYSLVDYLELKKEIPIAEAQSQFSSWLNRPIDRQYTLNKISKMQKEGYLQLAGDEVRFVKMYPAPHKGDYFKNFMLRWQNIPNAMYWDNLSREIIINYDYQMGEVYREEISQLQFARSREKRPEILADIDNRIKEKWGLAKKYYNEALVYGNDSISTFHNLAVIYMRNGIEDMDEQARSLLQQGVSLYKNSWGTYSLLFSFLISDSLKHPENELKNVEEAEKWFAQLKKELVHYRSSRGIYSEHPAWKNFAPIEDYISKLKQFPSTQLSSMESELDKQLKTTPGNIDVNMAQQLIYMLYNRGIPFQHQPYIQKADEYIEKVARLKPTDSAFIGFCFNISTQLQKHEKAFYYGKKLEAISKNPQDTSFYYNMGMIAYSSGNKPETKKYLNLFLNKIKDDKMALVQSRQAADNAKKILETLK